MYACLNAVYASGRKMEMYSIVRSHTHIKMMKKYLTLSEIRSQTKKRTSDDQQMKYVSQSSHRRTVNDSAIIAPFFLVRGKNSNDGTRENHDWISHIDEQILTV